MAKNIIVALVGVIISLIIGILIGFGITIALKSSELGRLQEQIIELEEKNASLESKKSDSQSSEKKSSKKAKASIKKTESSSDDFQFQEVKESGYIKDIYAKSGNNYLVIDYVQMLTGDTALKAAKEDGDTMDLEMDYYIRNQSKKLRTFKISSDVVITVKTWPSVGTKTITLSQLKNIFSSNNDDTAYMKDVPYWVTVANNRASTITEQYLP